MIYVSGTKDIKLDNAAVALGKFDGLHMGHQMLIDRITALKSKGMKAVMFTFDFHPLNLLRGHEMSLLYTSEERRVLAQEMGIDVLIEYPFTMETAKMDPVDFIKNILIGKLGTRYVVVGEDFHFGKDRKGDVKLLEGMSMPLGYKTSVCSKLTMQIPAGFDGNEKPEKREIGSTLIRKAVAEGDMELAGLMLGRPYSIIGEVVHGREIGRTIGMPTANVVPEPNKLLPPNGVYSSMTMANGKLYQSVTNIGFNPTVADSQARRSETYVYRFDGNLYGKQIQVQLYHYDRPEMKFSGVEELKAQIHRDKENAINYFRNRK